MRRGRRVGRGRRCGCRMARRLGRGRRSVGRQTRRFGRGRHSGGRLVRRVGCAAAPGRSCGAGPGRLFRASALTRHHDNEERRKGRIYRAANGAAEYRSHQDHCIVRCRDLEARDPCRLGPGRRGRARPANNHHDYVSLRPSAQESESRVAHLEMPGKRIQFEKHAIKMIAEPVARPPRPARQWLHDALRRRLGGPVTAVRLGKTAQDAAAAARPRRLLLLP